MSMNLVDQTTGELTQVAGNATDKVGNLNALTTTDKSSAVGAINEVDDKVKDVSNTLANYASLDIYISNSGEFPDANTVTKELVYINGFQSGLTNYPPEVSNTVGILITRWFYYSGDLTVARMQLIFTLGGKSFCRFTDGTSWTPWSPSSVGNINDLTTTDKSSAVGAINEVNEKANTYGIYTISNATSLSDFFFKLAVAADNDLSNKPASVIFNIIGVYENVDLFYGVIERTGLHGYFFTFIRSFGSKMYCGYVDITNSNMNLYEYSGTLVS